MSNRQAVYVIIFSVVEERDCQLQQVVGPLEVSAPSIEISFQVKYWLNTVSLRHSRFNRLLLVGTKIDLVSGDLDDALERCRCLPCFGHNHLSFCSECRVMMNVLQK